jgi:hypothetical protein
VTVVLTCLLVGLGVLLWPPRGERVPPSELSRQDVGNPVSVGRGGPRARSAGPDRASVAWAQSRGQSRGQSSGRSRRRGRGPDRQHCGPEDVADALVLVALGLRAGLPLTSALDHVRAGATGGVRDELAAVVAALRWGLPTGAAWGFAGRHWRPAAVATHLSERTGAGVADLLEAAASRMRDERERDRERAAARAGVLLVLPLGLGFLPAFACTAVVPVVVTLAAGVLSGGT